MTTVYKVVRRHNKNLLSACTYIPGFCVRYKMGTPVRPQAKKSLLTAFRTLKDAQRFLDENMGLHIYKAEADISRAQRVAPCHNTNAWQEPTHRVPIKDAHWPEGTVFCKSITLLERVE